MPVSWKINGVEAVVLRLARLQLTLVNQAADLFGFENPFLDFDTPELYTSAPEVVIAGGGGFGAAGVAEVDGGHVTSVTLTVGGSGYIEAPTVTLVGGGSSGASARALLVPTIVESVELLSAGGGFTAPPTVTVTGGGGSGAAIEAQIGGGGVSSIAITDGGEAYDSPPTVTITGGGGTGATAVAVLSGGAVTGVFMVTGGAGYTSAPTVTLTPTDGGTGATAIAVMTQGVTGVTITGGHTYYAEIPVSFDGGGGTGATGVSMMRGYVRTITLTDPGTGYTTGGTFTVSGSISGFLCGGTFGVAFGSISSLTYAATFVGGRSDETITVTFSGGGGTGATAVAPLIGCLTPTTLYTPGYTNGYKVVAYGSGYSTAPTVTVTGGGGTGAVLVALISGGQVVGVQVRQGGYGYTEAPTLSFSGGGGSGAAVLVHLNELGLGGVNITAPGNNYTSAPDVIFEDAPDASATAEIGDTDMVASFLVTAGGTGYNAAPTVTVTGGGGTGATATAEVASTVASITMLDVGTGYSTPPDVELSGGGGFGAVAVAHLGGATITALLLTSPGAGYTSRPTVKIIGGGGSGAKGRVSLVPSSVGSLELINGSGGFPVGTEIVLERVEDEGDPVTWFRGRLRDNPTMARPGESKTAYVAAGAWDWLERIPYLQNFKKPADAEDPESALELYLRGRAVVAQDDEGVKVSVRDFIESVITYAIEAGAPLAAEVEDSLDFPIPWDEVVDLKCSEVLQRVLQFVPDAVVWVDYAPSTPVLHFARRADLASLELPVLPPGSGEFGGAVRNSIELRERPDLQQSGVVLIYIATNRANGAAWEVPTVDAWPDDTVANAPDVLVRTIQLAGSVTQSTTLEQRVEIDPLPDALVYDNVAWKVSGDGGFEALRDWWYKHAPELQSAGITIKGFSKCLREGTSMGTGGQLDNELVRGSITDWMVARSSVSSEEQTITARIAYEEVLPNDATKKARHVKKFVAVVTATNASTKTYRHSEVTSYSPPEEVPVGLAQAIYEAVSVMHYDGSVRLIEREATLPTALGRVLNLTGGRATWAAMNALVQRFTIDLDRGTSEIKVGPPKHLGVDDTVELYRVNRNRQPVTSYLTRSTGSSGNGDNVQGLGFNFPRGAKASGVAQAPSKYTHSISFSSTFPTGTEIGTAIAAAYADDNIPVEGDTVILTVSGTAKLHAIVTLTNVAPDGWQVVSFTFSSVTYYAFVSQIGVWGT
jgi:hypothetical protein